MGGVDNLGKRGDNPWPGGAQAGEGEPNPGLRTSVSRDIDATTDRFTPCMSHSAVTVSPVSDTKASDEEAHGARSANLDWTMESRVAWPRSVPVEAVAV